MDELGAENLRDAIVMQAVDDYCIAVKQISRLNMKEYSINKIIEEKKSAITTIEDAEEERLHRINVNEATLYEIERFFFSQWYHELCNIDSDYMLIQTRDKALNNLVEKSIYDLNRITIKNINSKKSKRALLEYEMLKNLLYSEHLHRLTDKTAKEILRYIKDNVNCKACDFFV